MAESKLSTRRRNHQNRRPYSSLRPHVIGDKVANVRCCNTNETARVKLIKPPQKQPSESQVLIWKALRPQKY